MEHANCDLNMLFGILALQMDFISRDALIDAMHVWVLDKARPLGRILVERHALDAEANALLESLVRKHLSLHGEDPAQSLATCSMLAPLREELGRIRDPELHESLSGFTATGRGDRDPYATIPPTTPPTDGAPPPPPGSRFRILRPHARGGLGEVFVAHDEELNREVALKEIRCHRADDPDCRTRFLLEAEVTGGLEHPGIVSVYGLGQYADGRPYYAMRLIRGDSLQEAIERFHQAEGPARAPGQRALELRRLLGRFLDVCNAVTYAHSRSVLHRDLKPANIMLGPYGETLVVDWGLAKPLDPRPSQDGSAERPLRPSSASRLTAETMGMAIGTPQYMSPEQAAGQLDRLGPASDVYSLGATLYTLLTGQPPFLDRDPTTVLRKVLRGDFPPPRQVDKRIPQALEAICRKAMALKPGARYASPRALAHDLEHWLADEPVSAYPEPWTQRQARWGRRHRPLMAGAAALLVTAVAALSISTILITQEQARTARNFRWARFAVEEMLTQVGAVDLVDIPQMEGVRRQLLERALTFYRAFLQERSNETGLRQEAARAYGRLGDIQELLGEYDAAEDHYRRSIALLADLSAASPAAAEPLRLWARSLHHFGILLKKANRSEEAEDAFRQALRLRERLAPNSPDDLAALAETRYHLAALLARLPGRRTEDEALYHLALKDLRRLVATHPDRPELWVQQARSLNNLGILLQATDRFDDAEAAFLAAEKALGHVPPSSAGYRWHLARTENNRSALLMTFNLAAEAETSLRRANELLTQLQDDFPKIPDYRNELAAVCINLGSLLLKDIQQAKADTTVEADKAKVDKAEEILNQALTLLTGLVRDFPKRSDYRHRLAEARCVQGILLAETDRPREAEDAFGADLDTARKLVATSPDVPAYQSTLGCALDNLATLMMRTPDRLANAERFLTEAIVHHRIALASNVRNRTYRKFLLNDWMKLASIYRRSGRHVALSNAGEQLPRLAPEDPDQYSTAAWILTLAAALAEEDQSLSAAQRSELSQAYARRAVELLRDAVRRGFKNVEELEVPEDPDAPDDYKPLRPRDDFQQLLRELRANSRPAVG